jgi:glycosyltransferase involved in cell wall biosynthesis
MKQRYLPAQEFHLRIGIDLSCLNFPITGIGRYAYEITKRIISNDHIWYLYSNANIPLLSYTANNVNYRTCNSMAHVPKIFWQQTILPALCIKDNIDILWSPNGRIPLLLASNIAIVVTIHDLVWKFFPKTMRKVGWILDATLIPNAIKRAIKIITVSNSTANDIARSFPLQASKITTIYPAASSCSEDKKINLEFNFKEIEPYFLFVGTIEPRKNLKALLEAYSMLNKNTREKAKIVIAGSSGWGKIDLRKLSNELGISGQVTILGYVDNSLLVELYRRALFLAMPSLYEGFGLPLIEAITLGTPVLTSNKSSMPEVARNAGYYIDPENQNSILRGLNEMISNPKLRDQLRSNCEDVRLGFSWDKAAKKTLEIIECSYPKIKIN